MELANRIAIVTGAGSGIGRAIAVKLSQEGAYVVVNDYSLEAAEKTVAQIESFSGNAIPYQADITDRKRIFSMTEEIAEKFGSIDILVNNAGMVSSFLIEDLPPEVWDNTLAVNLTGTFNCTKAVIPYMIKNNYGKLLFIGSIAAHRTGGGGKCDYIASKHGVRGLMKEMAYELGRYNITSNMVCPGATLTDMFKSMVPEDEIIKMNAGVPTGSICTPEDIAESACFLVSNNSNQITGQSLDVVSGSMLSMGTGYSEQIKWHSELSKKKLNEWNSKLENIK
ncbi:MAG: SDR family oxidoreductase [bacterium]|nr:SDR family oxidoreductase [bacterium]